MTTYQFTDWEQTFLMDQQAKFAWILNLFMIATQIHPVFTRKHMITQILCEYCDKNREKTKKYEDYTHSYLQAHKLHKKEVKNRKKVKKAESSPAPLLVWAKNNLWL